MLVDDTGFAPVTSSVWWDLREDVADEFGQLYPGCLGDEQVCGVGDHGYSHGS
jgi:hypothetical protein